VRFERAHDTSPVGLRERFGRTLLVIKPSVGGGGHRVWRCADPDDAADVARTQLPRRAC
jgi:hypothetical protein